MRFRHLAALAALVLTVAACGGETLPTTKPQITGVTPASIEEGPTTTQAVPSTVTTVATDETAATTPTTLPTGRLTLDLEVVASGFEQPIFVTAPPGDDRLWVVDQPGRIWLVAGGDPEIFLDIRERVRFRGEQGLLGMAFAPQFTETGSFFVHYSDGEGDTVVSEFHATGDVGDPDSERVVLRVGQPASNHNGGMIAFGPDDLLWIGLGDGGGANDRFGQGQRSDTLLATILRIDPFGSPYGVPADNPFVDGGGAAEVWAYGLRNPWRFAFDGQRLFIADVGQDKYEEISILDTKSDAGANLGWPLTEGFACFSVADCDPASTFVVHDYDHGEGCSISGGYVYRGVAIPELTGHYFYSDFCSGFIRSLLTDGVDVVSEHDWTEGIPNLTGAASFGIDGHGELYLAAQRIGDQSGAIARFVRALP